MQSHNIIMPKNNNNKTHKNNKNIIPPTNNINPHHRSHGSATQACAACKYQRRKCASDCILAPYFPHDRQRQFLNAHRLFGVSNIVKIVRHLQQPAKDHAMRTIIYQSDARAADPVGGCHRIIRDLEQQISLAQAELEIVLHHLALCRAASHGQQLGPPVVAAVAGNCCDEKWRPEDGVLAVDEMNSWGCGPVNVVDHANTAESISSSFPHDHNINDGKLLSMEECNEEMIRPILDQLTCDDDVGQEFKFDFHGNIIPSNSSLSTEEKATFKEDDDCFSFVQDQHNLKAAASIFSLTNCDV